MGLSDLQKLIDEKQEPKTTGVDVRTSYEALPEPEPPTSPATSYGTYLQESYLRDPYKLEMQDWITMPQQPADIDPGKIEALEALRKYGNEKPRWQKALEGIDRLLGAPVREAVKVKSEAQRKLWFHREDIGIEDVAKLLDPGIYSAILGVKGAIKKPIEETYVKTITEPWVKDVAKTGEVGEIIAAVGYGYDPGRPLSERSTNAMLKAWAASGKIDAEPSDFPGQLNPLGIANFAGDMGLSLDWLIGGGLTKAGKLAGKAATLPLTKAGQAAKGLRAPLMIAGKSVLKPQVAEAYYKTTAALGQDILKIPGVGRIAGAFSKHVGPGAPIYKIADEMMQRATRWITRTGVIEDGLKREVTDVLKKYDLDEANANAIISDITEKFGKEPGVPGVIDAPPPQSLSTVVKQSLPEVTDVGDAETISKAIDHYIHLGEKSLSIERSVGIPIKELASGDMNYLLHYLTDEARESVVRWTYKGRVKPLQKTGELRLAKDIFHESTKGRKFDMTIREANELAANGQIFVKNGKLGILDPGVKLPKGAKIISKLFEDDPARLAVIRQMRTARAVTSKQFLDDVWDVVDEYEGIGATTLPGRMGKKAWDETFGTLGEAAEKYATKTLHPQDASAILHGIHKIQGFTKAPKGAALAAYDRLLNIWKPIQLYLYPKYYNRNYGSALWNEFLNDNIDGVLLGQAEILQAKRMVNHELWNEAKEWGVVGRSQFTADIERGMAFGKQGAETIAGDVKEFAKGATTLGATGDIGKLGELQENFIRFGSYIGWRRKGYSPRLSTRKVMESQFDYLDLTAFEWNTMRRLMPFYTWSRKNIPFQISRLIEKPARGLAPLRGIRGAEPEWMAGERELIPDYISDRFPVKLGEDKYAPLEDTWAMMDINKILPSKAGEEIMQSLSPGLKIPFELYAKTVGGRVTGWGPLGEGAPTGYSLFLERPIETWYRKTDTVWGRPLPAKIAYLLKGNIRFINEIEKSPLYPVDEKKVKGQSPFAKAIQTTGIPYYENKPQQQIHWRIKDLERKQDEMGGIYANPKAYKNAAMEIIFLRGMQDKYLEPFRREERDVHSEKATLYELSALTGVDMLALKAEHGDKWREAAMQAPNVITDFGQLRAENPGMSDGEIAKAAFDQLYTIAEANAFSNGGIEIYQSTLNEAGNLLAKDDIARTGRGRISKFLTDEERKWVNDVIVGNLVAGLEYLDADRKAGGNAWFDHQDKIEQWTKAVYQKTGMMPKQVQQIHEDAAFDEYGKLTLVKTAEGFTKRAAYAKRLMDDPYLSDLNKGLWWERWKATQREKYDWMWEKGQRDSALSGMRSIIKDETLPLSTRREFARQYAQFLKEWIDKDPSKKSRLKWVEDNITPLFQEPVREK